MFIAVICALLFFANIVRRTWLLPGVGLALFAISAVLLGGVWPGPDAALPGQARRAGQGGVVHRQEHPGHPLRVRPRRHHGQRVRRPDRAVPVPAEHRRRVAPGHPPGRPAAGLGHLRAAAAGPRLLQRARRCSTSTATRSTARSATSSSPRASCTSRGLPDAQKKWANEKTVYTHGYGLIAAFGNQRNAGDQPVGNDGEPVWAEEDLPPRGAITDVAGRRAATARRSTSASRARRTRSSARPSGGKDVELDVPQGERRPRASRRPTPTRARTASRSATSSASCSTR